jgi:hypothetical protein
MEILTDPYNGGGSNPTTGNRETMPHGSVEGELAYSNAQLTPALKRTQNVMAQLLTVPTNKSILNKLPPEVFMKDPSTNQAMYPPVLLDAWNSPILFAPGRGTLPPADVQWGVAGMYVTGDPNSPSKDNPSTWNAFLNLPTERECLSPPARTRIFRRVTITFTRLRNDHGNWLEEKNCLAAEGFHAH